MPQLWIQDALSLCDVGILTYTFDGLNNIYCSPNKLFEYTQAGLPVVATAQPSLVNIVRKYDIGAIVGETNYSAEPSEFADAVIEVLNNYQSYKANLEVFRENSVQAEQQLLLDSVSNIMLDNIYSNGQSVSSYSNVF